MDWALVSLAGWKSPEKVTEGTAYFLEYFSVCSFASAAGSTLKEPGSPRVLSLLQCPEAGPFEGRGHRRQGRPRKWQKGCMFCTYIKLCICWKQRGCLFSPFFLPISLPALPSLICSPSSMSPARLPRPPLLPLLMYILLTFLSYL